MSNLLPATPIAGAPIALLPAVASTHRKPLMNVVHNVDALVLLRSLSAGSIDAVITDPPYAEVERDYGKLTEAQWRDLMYPLVIECRRVLKPTGSAVFILQSNMERMGSMRLWLWEFMVYCGRTWNIVQDVYWWNYAKIPTAQANREHGLMRPSVKNCVWVGADNCYRNQDEVLWTPSDAMMAESLEDRALKYTPSGTSVRRGRVAETVQERGGTTPFNLLPIANANSTTSAGAFGHSAGTPDNLLEWWIRYISKPGDVILDPFMGSGTTALASRQLNRHFIGSEKDAGYIKTARARLETPYMVSMFNPIPAKVETEKPGLVQQSLFAGMTI